MHTCIKTEHGMMVAVAQSSPKDYIYHECYRDFWPPTQNVAKTQTIFQTEARFKISFAAISETGSAHLIWNDYIGT